MGSISAWRGVMYFSKSQTRTPPEMPTTYMANLMYLCQAALNCSPIIRVRIAMMGRRKSLSATKQATKEITKVTISRGMNMGRLLEIQVSLREKGILHKHHLSSCRV